MKYSDLKLGMRIEINIGSDNIYTLQRIEKNGWCNFSDDTGRGIVRIEATDTILHRLQCGLARLETINTEHYEIF